MIPVGILIISWECILSLYQNQKIDIVVLDMPLLNTMNYKDLILQLLSYMAEDERKRIRERQKEGITIAFQKGVKFGRKKVEIDDNFKETYQEWKNHKITAVEAMQRVGMKSNTFYRRVKEYEYEHNLEEKKLY